MRRRFLGDDAAREASTRWAIATPSPRSSAGRRSSWPVPRIGSATNGASCGAARRRTAVVSGSVNASAATTDPTTLSHLRKRTGRATSERSSPRLGTGQQLLRSSSPFEHTIDHPSSTSWRQRWVRVLTSSVNHESYGRDVSCGRPTASPEGSPQHRITQDHRTRGNVPGRHI